MRSPLLFLGALLVVALTTALFAPYFIDWSSYRHQIETYAEQVTGRAVTIVGDVSVRLLPAPRIVVSDVRVANPPDTVSERFVAARSVNIDVALGPLLKGRVEVTSVVIDGAVFEFEHMGSGVGNWGIEPAGVGILAPENVAIRQAVIRDGVVILRDGTRDGAAKLTDVDVVVTAQSLAGPYSLSGTVRHEDAPVDVVISTGRRSADGDMRLSVRLTQDGGRGSTYGFDGIHSGRDDEPGLEGRLTIARPVPRSDEADGGDLPFALRATVKGTLASFVLSDISLLLDQRNAATEISGDLSVDIGETIEVTAEFGAGHLDLDGLAANAGMQIEDLVPDLSFIDALPAAFDYFPAELDAVVRVHAGALTVAGETIEAARLDASYAESVLVIDELSGRVPGRGQLRVSSARYDAGLEDPAFRGTFELNTRDTRGFARWVWPQLGDWLESRPRGLRGGSTMSGELTVDGRAVALSGTHLELQDMIVDGELLFDPGDRPRLDLVLAVSELDLDPFVATSGDAQTAGAGDARSLEALRAAAVDLFTATAPGIARRMDGSLDLKVAKLGWNRLGGGPVVVRGKTHDGTMALSEFSVRGFHQLDFAGNARMDWTGGMPMGGMWLEVSSANPDHLLDIVAWPRGGRIDEAEARAALRRAAPLRFGVALSTGGEETEPRTEIEIDARMGSVDVTANGIVVGDWSSLEHARLDLEGRALAPNSDALMTLAGLPALLREEPGGQREVASFSLVGVLADGATSTLDMYLYDGHGRAEGVTEWTEGRPLTRASVSLESDDGTNLLRAIGFERDTADASEAKMSLEGRVAMDGLELTVHSMGGAVGSNAIGFSGVVDLDGATRSVSGSLTLARASLPWLAKQAFGTRRDISDLIASGVLDTAVEWNSLPFVVAGFPDLELDLAFDVGEVVVDKRSAVEGATGRLTFADGALALQGMRGTVFGGGLVLDGGFTNKDGEITLDLRYALENASLGRALADGSGGALAEGSLTVHGALAASGRSPLGLVSSLDGEGTFELSSGALVGVDPEAFSTALQLVTEPDDLDALMGDVLTSNAMPVESLSGEFSVTNGLVRIAPVAFSGVGAHGSAGGQVDLTAWRLDTKWSLLLDEYPEAPAFSVLHKGELDGAERTYDVAALHSYLVVRGLSEGVRRLEELQRQEEEELARIEELERRAAEQAAARALADQIERRDAARGARQEELDAAVPVPDPSGDGNAEVPANIAALPGETDPEIVGEVETGSADPQGAEQQPTPAPAPEPQSDGDVVILELPGSAPEPAPVEITPPAPAPAVSQAPAPAPLPEDTPLVEGEPDRSNQGGRMFSDDPMDLLR